MPDSQRARDQSVNDSSGNPSAAYSASSLEDDQSTGMEPVLGGALAEKAVWVDEAVCIGPPQSSESYLKPSLLSPIWDVPERFARTGIALSAFKRRSKLALWIAFTGLPLMTSRAYKRSLILRSFFRSVCPHLLAHGGFFLGSRNTELRWHQWLPWLCQPDALVAQSWPCPCFP